MTSPGWVNPPYRGANAVGYSEDGFTAGIQDQEAFAQWCATVALPAGKSYFEITNVTSSVQTALGVINQFYLQANTRQNYNSTQGSAWVAENGAVIVNGNVVDVISAANQGVTTGIATDTGAGKIWFCTSTSGGAPLWNNNSGDNPATGVGGYDISALPLSTLVAFYSVNAAPTNTNVATLNVGGSSYVYAAPSGFGNVTGAQWNPDAYECGGTYTLSNGGLTATAVINGALNEPAFFAATGASSGKYYCEFSQSVDGGIIQVGLASLTYNSALGPSAAIAIVGNDGKIFINGANPATLGAISTGVVGMATDLGGAEIWFRLGSGDWNDDASADPVAGVGGFSISFIGLPAAPIAGSSLQGSSVLLLNSGQVSYAETVPSGFSNWPSSTPPPPVDQLPVRSRLPLMLSAFGPYRPFAGRGPRRVSVAASPAPVAPPPPASRDRAAHAFRNKAPFAGAAPRHVALVPLPAPAAPQLPSGLQRRLQAFAAFFGRTPFPGRAIPRRDFRYFGGGTGNPPRASQIVAEALVTDAAGARATQLILEALNRTGSGVRASQTVVEALAAQTSTAVVRASQVVLEVLVPFSEVGPVPVYPEVIGLNVEVTKRPKTSIGRGIAASGREIAVNYWANPQWEWDLAYDVLLDTGAMGCSTTPSDIKTMIGFFLYCAGTYSPFYFRDPDDNAVLGQALGSGDGVTTQFVFVRTYGQGSSLGDFVGTEPIGGINVNEPPPVIYINGTAQETGFTVDTSTPYGNVVTFDVAPGAGLPVTADFSFWYFCRLKDDTADYTKFMQGVWGLKKITIFSLKN